MSVWDLTPWYGLENMETDEPIVTTCGRTVEPIRWPCTKIEETEIAHARAVKEGSKLAREMSLERSINKVMQDWSHYEI